MTQESTRKLCCKVFFISSLSPQGSHIASEMSVGSFALAWHTDIPSTPTRAANVPISGLLRRGVWEVQNTEEREMAERGRGRESTFERLWMQLCICNKASDLRHSFRFGLGYN